MPKTPQIITDITKNPAIVVDGQSTTPFRGVTVATAAPLNNTETVTIKLAQALSNDPGSNFNFYPTASDLGTLTDPNGGGTFDKSTETFTESGLIGGDPTFATDLLKRLIYQAPMLPDGQAFGFQATITVSDPFSTMIDPNPVIVGVVAPPAITGTVTDQPITSGDKIPPFATVTIADPYWSYNYYTKLPGLLLIHMSMVPTMVIPPVILPPSSLPITVGRQMRMAC